MPSFVFMILIIAFLIVKIQTVSVTNNFNFRVCTNNETKQIKVWDKQTEDGTTNCQCQVNEFESKHVREDYVYEPEIGLYKLHIHAKTWNEARQICNHEGAHLAIINSKAEEAVLVSMLNAAGNKIKGAESKWTAFLGIHDMFNEGEWLTIFGESIYATGYSEWTSLGGNQPDNAGGNENCGALITNGGMNDVTCNDKYSFFCEMPVTC